MLGIVAGTAINSLNPAYAEYIRPFSQLFLRLIKMIIAPLMFATLVAGVAGAGHAKDVGRMGLRAIIYFEVVTTIALVIGLVAVNIAKPGVGVVAAGPAGRSGAARRPADMGPDSAACRPRVGDRRHGRATCCRS